MTKIKRYIPRKNNEINRVKLKGRVGRMEVAKVTSMSPIGESIQAIRSIANKYMKTVEDEQKAEERLRAELKKQGYTRF